MSDDSELTFEFREGCPDGDLAKCVYDEETREEAVVFYYSEDFGEYAEEDCAEGDGTFTEYGTSDR